ncbi:Uncharacterised protein [uncultured archaeon]|nr:Uncharacterised protein [uncultured archaeon]
MELIVTPGATTSGSSLPNADGPRLLNDAIVSSETTAVVLSSDAPTVITFFDDPGVDIVPVPGPSFPAATTTTTPLSTAASDTIFNKSVNSSVGCEEPPRDMLIILAPRAILQSIPAITFEVVPEPA